MDRVRGSVDVVGVDVDGEQLVVVSFTLAERGALPLTPAEMEVARYAAEGASGARIAALRGTSRRTIANQLASVFRKLRVSSRVELAAALADRWSHER